jgi:hypothetical protein
MTTAPTTPLQAALAYAVVGWQVGPLNWPTAAGCSCLRADKCASPGKHPWVRWKETGGSTDPGLIRWWWRKRPESNVCIFTGRDRSGLWVLDIDPDHGGGDTLERLQVEHGPLPATLAAVTGSGGRHLIFRHPGGTARQTAGTIGAGIDTRSDGGLIVAAPSLHRSGRRYHWVNWGTPPADIPGWLLDLVQAPKRNDRPVIPLPARGTTRGSRYAEAALVRNCEQVRTAPAGQRNVTLNQASYAMGRLVGAGLISEARARSELVVAADAAGLGSGETEATLDSGLGDGQRSPKGMPA